MREQLQHWCCRRTLLFRCVQHCECLAKPKRDQAQNRSHTIDVKQKTHTVGSTCETEQRSNLLLQHCAAIRPTQAVQRISSPSVLIQTHAQEIELPKQLIPNRGCKTLSLSCSVATPPRRQQTPLKHRQQL